jgi:Protein of unknown function (DUF1236)
MKTTFRHGKFCGGAIGAGAVTLALCGGLGIAVIGAASAQIGSTPPQQLEDGLIGRGDTRAAPLRFSPEQKNAISDAVRRANKPVEPSVSFVASVGAPVPPVIELYILPDAVLAAIPAAKTVKYTVMKNQLIIVDPLNMRVVDIIPQ